MKDSLAGVLLGFGVPIFFARNWVNNVIVGNYVPIVVEILTAYVS